MIVTLLHISDLHRDPTHELSNNALIDSLEADRQRYEHEDPAILPPTIAVVSGDLIYGVRQDHADPIAEIDRQYQQADDFLNRLANSFFAGDRNRIVLLPGNHDVSFPATMQSLEQLVVNPADPATKELVKQLWAYDSNIRWNWNTLSFWRIANPDNYAARLDGFRRFYDRFYNGLGRRPYSLRPQEQYDVFDFPAENITVVAMSSCFHNDPLRRQGMIHPECVSDASQRVHDPAFQGRLLVASWHHNTSGGPATADYMDADVLQVLIDRGFSIGLHGHQHKPQFIDERFALGGTRKITVLSASTLCAGPNALPPGHRRGYNILRIDTDTYSASLHQRSMLNDDFALPVWGPGTFALSGTSVIEFEAQHPIVRVGSVAATNAILAAAEQDIRNRQFENARTKLNPIRNTPVARPLLLEALSQLRDAAGIVAAFMPPTNVTEMVHVANAAWELHDLEVLRDLLALPEVANSDDPTIRELRERFGPRL